MRKLTITLWICAALVGLWAVAERTDRPWSDYSAQAPDIAFDKITAKAAWDGIDTSQPLEAIGEQYEYVLRAPHPHPRTPGGLLLQIPLAWVPDGALIAVMGVLSVASLLMVCWATSRLSAVSLWATGLVALVLAGTRPMVNAYSYGNTGVVVAGLVVAGWVLFRSRPVLAGGLLAAASVLKVWPVLVVLVLLLHRESAGKWAVGFGGGLSAAGLLMPGVSLAGWVGVLSTSADVHSSLGMNTSLTGLVGLPFALAVAVFLMAVSIRYDLDGRVGLAIVSALVLSPLSWPWYWVAALPLFALAVVGPSNLRPSTLRTTIGSLLRRPPGWSPQKS